MKVEANEQNSDEQIYATDKDDLTPTSAEVVVKLGEDYADYLNIDTSVERKKYGDAVDEMLTKLDEFCGLVDMIRSDTALCLTRTVPEIQEKCQEMEKIFAKVDKLEMFVGAVRKNVAVMEERVSKAEDEMGSLSGIRKIFSSISMPSFMSPKKSANKAKAESKPAERSLSYDSPEIFDTDKFFISSS